MRLRSLVAVFCALLSYSASGYAAHNALLPRPQQITYGMGHLALRGLKIEFASQPSPEDQFAAAELSRLLGSRTGAEIPVLQNKGSGPAIVLNRTGPVDALPMPGERPGPDSREAYEIKVTSAGVTIRAASSAGIYYGAETLRELVEGQDKQAILPEVSIHDWPVLAYGGTMVGMSEGPLPTKEEVERQLDFLARWKANQYYFYNEDSIELKGYPLLNLGARFTKEQVREIIAYGRKRHIDVIPCLELYGHQHYLFRIERYSDLAAFPHGEEFNPFDPRVKGLIADWVNQYADLFPSPFVHIGFNEVWQIKQAAKKQGSAVNPAKLFTEQLNEVTRLFEKRGKYVMAWEDMMVKFPAIFPGLSPGLIAVAWHYDPYPDPTYKKWLAPLANHHVPHFVAPGVRSWSQIAPDFKTTFTNIDTFFAAGHKSGAEGVMNTVWTDDRQMLMRASWPGMAYGGVAAWQSGKPDSEHFLAEYAKQMYPAAIAQDVGTALESLSEAETELQQAVGQDSINAIWGNPFKPQTLATLEIHRNNLRQERLLAERAEALLLRAMSRGGTITTLPSSLVVARMLDYVGMKDLYAVEISQIWRQQREQNAHPTREHLWDQLGNLIYSGLHNRLGDLMDEITDLQPLYKSAWLDQYTPYRMGTALGRWDAEYEYWRALQARLLAFSDSFKTGEALPPFHSFTNVH